MLNISTKMQSDSGSVRKAKALIFHLNSAFPSDKKNVLLFHFRFPVFDEENLQLDPAVDLVKLSIAAG